ncbi:sugar ABC transporter ATP-binding protein [Metabacillus idriensis]|uniref:sugar ABC transporter ATP-binding protein n=1 Tax=Metabacillus idriensis TaxID=324768 RepID=UPI0017497334|nr:sugar ABC transporter ATP-binding protein [Metabacillus idriensis]
MLINLVDISKSFYDNKVLKNVNFQLKPGEVHGIVGQNGAGKSTLMKIISGIYSEDAGDIFVQNKRVSLTPNKAKELGITMIYQEPVLINTLTVTENIFLGIQPTILKIFPNKKKMRSESRRILKLIGSSVDPNLYINQLNSRDRYIVTIAQALVRKSKIIIMDEPTSKLNDFEKECLFKVIEKLKKQGIGIIFITHRLREVFQICDKITVLRDGEHIITCGINDFSENQIISHMLGRELTQVYPPRSTVIGKQILKVKHLTRKSHFQDINFSLHEGEILGIAGIKGDGQTQLVKTIFGIRRRDEGEIFWKNEKIDFKTPHDAIRQRIGIVNEDRYESSLLMNMSVTNNVTISSLDKFNKWNFIQQNKEQDSTLDKVIDLNIKLSHPKQQINHLSGGNQQKVILGRWLMADSDLFILDEPTQGVDIGARTEIYQAINELAIKGKAVLINSTDIQELIGLCNRIIVMHKGRIVDEIFSSDTSEDQIIKLLK